VSQQDASDHRASGRNDIEDKALFDAYKESDQESVRDLARQHTNLAIDTLVKLMKGPKTPPGVKRACAADILNQGWGRPDSRDGGGDTNKGLIINILKLSTGVVESSTHEGKEFLQVVDAIDVAKAISDGVEVAPE
jgi:hypothetical protein